MRLNLATTVLYILFALSPAVANVDSLRNEVRGTSTNVTEKGKALRQLVTWYANHQLDSAMHYAHAHLHWAEASGDTIPVVDALQVLATINQFLSNPHEAEEYVEQAAHLIDQTGNLTYKFHNLNLRAAIAGDLFDSAGELHHNQQALIVATKLGDSALITMSLNNLANLHKSVGNLDEAIACYTRALEICEARNDLRRVNIIHLNQAQLSNDRGEFAQTIERLRPVIAYFTSHNHKNYLAFAYSAVGFSYFGLQDYQQALTYSKQCKKMLEETRSTYGLAEALMLMGNSYAALNKKDSALHFLTRAMDLVEEKPTPEEFRSCSKALYEFHKQQNNPTQALHFYERYIAVKDSIEGIAARNKIQEAQMRFKLNEAHYQDSLLFEQVLQTERMEEQIAQSKRNTYFAIALFAIILSSIVVLIYLRFKNLKEKLEKRTLLNQLDKLKSAVVKDLVLADEPHAAHSPAIDRLGIEKSLSVKLNDTDWAILLELYQTPMLTNKDLAQQVNKSFEGVRSSLKKMYRLFDLNQTTGNRKAALIIKAIELSCKEDGSKTATQGERYLEKVESTLH